MVAFTRIQGRDSSHFWNSKLWASPKCNAGRYRVWLTLWQWNRPRFSAPFSSLVALYSSLEFFSRANTFETTPLVPGRSVYAEEVCPVVSELYDEKVPPGYEPEGQEPPDVSWV